MSTFSKWKTNKSGILSKVQDDLKGHEAFNLHNLVDNPFTAGDSSHFTIKYNVYNGEVINIGDKQSLKNIEQNVKQPPGSEQIKKSDEEMEVDPPSNPDISIQSSASAELNHQQGSTREQMIKDLLKACFDSDKNTRSKIETQIQTMFPDTSGMFQAVLWSLYHTQWESSISYEPYDMKL